MKYDSSATDINSILALDSGEAIDPCRSGCWIKSWADGETISLEKLFTIADVDYAYSFVSLNKLKGDITALLASVLSKYLGRNKLRRLESSMQRWSLPPYICILSSIVLVMMLVPP